MKFNLIQRGNFRTNGEGLTGRKGVVDLDYMGSSEFEFGAIPRSFRRVMYDFDKYIYVPTKIMTKERNELILFSNEENAEEVLDGLCQFVYHPYHLKEYSELEKIPYSSVDDTGYKKLRTNFWWCIEYGKDWMAFLKSQRELFEQGINYDFNNWWMVKSPEEREQEYQKSLRLY